MSHFVFVESNTTGTGRIVIERLLAREDRITFLTRSREKYPFLAAPSPGLRIVDAETNDPGSVLAAIDEIARHARVDAILTFSDFYVDIVAEVAARLGFRYLSPSAARTCRNKPLTRQALRSAGLPTPEFRRVSSAEEARELAHILGPPWVVKPPADSSSYGVRIVHDVTELEAHVRALAAEETNVRGQRLDGTVLVESYLEGPEYSVETVTLPDGSTAVIGVTDKHLSPAPHFVETGHDFPSASPPEIVRALSDAVLRALAAVGFDFGPAHTEVRWTARGPVVVEINPRLAGGMIPELVLYATGIDLLDGLIDLLAGRVPRLSASRSEVAAIRFLTADRRGRLAGLRGAEQARQLPSVREIRLEKRAGTLVQPAENAYHRLGFVIAAGADAERVRSDIEEAVRLLHVEVETDEGMTQENR
jgi:biotin carboxylase